MKNHVVAERFIFLGKWTTVAPVHIGAEERDESSADMQLAVDSHGKYYIPGASIAGAARSYLAKCLQNDTEFRAGNEQNVLRALFGDDFQSLLTVFDAPCTSSARPGVRDGIEIDQKTGIAADKRKYLIEVLEAGVTFEFCVWLSIYPQNPFKVDRSEILRLVRTMLEGFSAEHEIQLGAKVRKGWGKGKVDNWMIWQYRMPDHIEQWLNLCGLHPVSRDDAGEVIDLNKLGQPLTDDQRRYFTIEADLAVKTSILVRRTSEVLDEPDFIHTSANGQGMIPGTSAAGALRARVEKIAKTVLPDADGMLNSMLGPRYDDAKKTPLTAGRLWIEEQALEKGSLRVQGRNSIDRFTGGTIDGALFHEAPWWPDSINQENWKLHVALELTDDDVTTRKEAALILHAFRDLWVGDLSIGGEASGGRGVFLGVKALLEFPGKPKLTMRRAGEDTVTVAFEGSNAEAAWKEWGAIETALVEQ